MAEAEAEQAAAAGNGTGRGGGGRAAGGGAEATAAATRAATAETADGREPARSRPHWRRRGGGGGGSGGLNRSELEHYATLLANKVGGELPEAAEALSEAQLGQALELFRTHDGDDNGVLDYTEFAALMTELAAKGGAKFDQMYLRATFHRLDADHSHEVDFIEYVSLLPGLLASASTAAADANAERVADRGEGVAMREKAAMRQLVADFKSEGLTEAEVVRAAALFKRHDATHRGALSPRSFSSLMVKAGAADGIEYTEAELQGLLRRADLDADGDIDFYELTELLSRQKRLRKHVEEKELIQKRKAEVDARNAAKYAAEATEKAKIEAAEKRNKERLEALDRQIAAAEADEAVPPPPPELEAQESAEHREQRQAWEAGGTMDDKEGYRQMIREEVDASGVLGEMPHMTPEMEEMIIAFYVKFDTRAQVTDLHCRCHLLHHRHLTHHIHLPQGKLSKADFVEGMRAYGKAAGNEKAYKTQLLELAFEAADTDAQNELSLAHFLRYVGRGGRLNVLPRAFAEAADYDLRGKLHHKKASQEEIDEAGARVTTTGGARPLVSRRRGGRWSTATATDTAPSCGGAPNATASSPNCRIWKRTGWSAWLPSNEGAASPP